MPAGWISPPLVILAGSDRVPGPVPPGAERLHFVTGYKGADVTVDGRCLAAVILDRCRASGCFGDTYVAGPAAIFRDRVDAEIIDTDSTLGENLREIIRVLGQRYERDTAVAFVTCDILPTVAEIQELCRLFEPHAGSALLFEVVEVDPARLGVSAWKPRYRMRPAPGAEPRHYLPGHLVVARPAHLRLRFLFKLFEAAYRNRNRELETRRRVLVRSVLWGLIKQDLVNLFYLKAPTLTYTVLRYGLGTFMKLKRDELHLAEFENGLAHVFLKRRYRHEQVRVLPVSAMSFARDLDTQEEVDEVAGGLAD